MLALDGSLLPWLLAVTASVTANLSRSQRRYARMVAQLPPPQQQENPFIDVDERLDRLDRRQVVAAAIMSLATCDRVLLSDELATIFEF